MPSYHVAREVEILASPHRVYEVLADYRTWKTWSPWLISEPEAIVTVSDDPSSVGSQYTWKGKVTGEGALQHRKLPPSRKWMERGESIGSISEIETAANWNVRDLSNHPTRNPRSRAFYRYFPSVEIVQMIHVRQPVPWA
jgi:hypothetical protein